MFERLARPVSDIYTPETPGHHIIDVPPDELSIALGYSAGREVDEGENDVPVIDDAGNFRGNTAVYRILKNGNTGVLLATTVNHLARYKISVLSGEVELVRSHTSGYVEDEKLSEGDSVSIKQGQAFSFVNAGKQDALLRSEAYPACNDRDIVAIKPLTPTEALEAKQKERPASGYWAGEMPDGSQVYDQLAYRFNDMVSNALAGNNRPKSILRKAIEFISSRKSA